MTRISSKQVYFLKWIFPVLFLVVMLVPIGIGLTVPRNPPPVAIFFMPLVMIPILFLVLRKFVWDLMDEVYDGGDYLLVKKGDKEDRIALSNIMNVSATLMVNPPRVTLRLVNPSRFGKEVSFSPVRPVTLNPFARNTIADDLIERVDKARRK
ncbi:MAG: hypothetical protein WA190_09775 [Usitatibacter sp.]